MDSSITTDAVAFPDEKEYSFGEYITLFGSGRGSDGELINFAPDAGKAMEMAVLDWFGDEVDERGLFRRSMAFEEGMRLFNSAARTYDEQVEMRNKYGAGGAKLPGTSLHEDGIAVDIQKSDFRDWLVENGSKYGWHQRKYGGTIDPMTGQMTGEKLHHFEYEEPVKTVEDGIVDAFKKAEEFNIMESDKTRVDLFSKKNEKL